MRDDDSPLAKAFGALLRQLRQNADLTQAGLGDRVRPPLLPQAVARYESGERAPTLTLLYRLAAALGVSPCELLPEMPAKKRKEK